MTDVKRLLLLVVVAFAPIACTKAFSKLAYNSLLPRIIIQRTDKYFDLNTNQEKQLAERIKIHHDWHRATQLKLYAADLAQLKQRFARKLTDNDIDWLIERLTVHRNTLFARLIPDLATLLQTLSSQQITHLQKALTEENSDLQKKLRRPLAERQAVEFATVIRQIEDWTGNLSDDQKLELRVKYAALPDSAGEWLNYRMEQQAVFVQLLQSKPDRQLLVKDLEARMIYQEKNMPKRYQSAFARTARLIRQMVLSANHLLTPEQRKRVLARADEYIQLIRELAK